MAVPLLLFCGARRAGRWRSYRAADAPTKQDHSPRAGALGGRFRRAYNPPSGRSVATCASVASALSARSLAIGRAPPRPSDHLPPIPSPATPPAVARALAPRRSPPRGNARAVADSGAPRAIARRLRVASRPRKRPATRQRRPLPPFRRSRTYPLALPSGAPV